MKKIKIPRIPEHDKRWLWWMAALIVVAGCMLIHFFQSDRSHPAYQARITNTTLITVIAAGLCVISATSGWWLKR